MLFNFLILGVIYRVCGLRLGSNFGLGLTMKKNFYLQLTVEKMHAFAVFTKKYLRSYGSSVTNFITAVNCRNKKTEMLHNFLKDWSLKFSKLRNRHEKFKWGKVWKWRMWSLWKSYYHPMKHIFENKISKR